ncbi:adenylate/guanylate cyclase domain-containing protein [Chitinimonas lacunae]|uniref:Guanylate cyclase domain-containing protein n=1 Tax=Chitinimonas lacunae TaxID=1963018 RepID=A0ABV8MI51_9NEIS
MFDRSNKTLICSVVFLDLVAYSKQAVAEQIRLKEQFNNLLSNALHDIAANDRIVLDTGDGAAINFLGDPEDALFVAINLRDAAAEMGLKIRIGINLGPVKLVKDVNGRLTPLGDGINVAQRIMGFAEPGAILVSRSYHEVVSCLSDVYAELFQFEGSRTDKHVREHAVYAVGPVAADFHPRHHIKRHHDLEGLLNEPMRLNKQRRWPFPLLAAGVAMLLSAGGLVWWNTAPRTPELSLPPVAQSQPIPKAEPMPIQPAVASRPDSVASQPAVPPELAAPLARSAAKPVSEPQEPDLPAAKPPAPVVKTTVASLSPLPPKPAPVRPKPSAPPPPKATADHECTPYHPCSPNPRWVPRDH